MPLKRYQPEQIIGKLREAEVFLSQGLPWTRPAARSRRPSRPTTAGGRSMAAFGWTRPTG